MTVSDIQVIKRHYIYIYILYIYQVITGIIYIHTHTLVYKYIHICAYDHYEQRPITGDVCLQMGFSVKCSY